MLTVYKKNSKLTILFLCVFALLLTSCNQEVPNERCNLHLSIDSNNLLDKSREIVPIDDDDIIVKYALTLEGPDDETKSIELDESTGSIDDLAIGYWTINVSALNANGTSIATGQKIIYLTKKTNEVEVKLDKLVGIGILKVDFQWDEDQVVSDDVDVVCTVASEDGNQVEKSKIQITNNKNTENGRSLIVGDLPAGSYIVSAKLISNDVCISGIVEPIRVINEGVSLGTVEFLIGEKANHFSLNIIPNVMLPVSGKIVCDTENPKVNQEFKLTFNADALPAGVDSSTLKYEWYCEGVQIADANGPTITTSCELGKHRFDVIVFNSFKGSVGGTSFNVETTR